MHPENINQRIAFRPLTPKASSGDHVVPLPPLLGHKPKYYYREVV